MKFPSAVLADKILAGKAAVKELAHPPVAGHLKGRDGLVPQHPHRQLADHENGQALVIGPAQDPHPVVLVEQILDRAPQTGQDGRLGGLEKEPLVIIAFDHHTNAPPVPQSRAPAGAHFYS